MSSGDGGSYKSYTDRSTRYASSDASTRSAALEERESVLRDARSRMKEEAPRERAKAAPKADEIPVEQHLANNCIDAPPAEAQELDIILVDNSGSNRAIAESIRRASGYIHTNASVLAGTSAIAFQFFSDHCDGLKGLFQEAGYTMPGEHGEKVLRASVARIFGAGGGDAPEAIECALLRASEYSFGTRIPKEKRHLYLVTDEIAHHMGPKENDDGCPDQVDWKKSLQQAHGVFGSFQVIASGHDAQTFELQKKFLAENRVQWDLLNLATGNLTHEERCRLVPNSILFLVARNRGRQTVEMFLMTLYEKWLANPQYGSDSERRARLQISDFAQYLEIEANERAELLKRVFGKE